MELRGKRPLWFAGHVVWQGGLARASSLVRAPQIIQRVLFRFSCICWGSCFRAGRQHSECGYYARASKPQTPVSRACDQDQPMNFGLSYWMQKFTVSRVPPLSLPCVIMRVPSECCTFKAVRIRYSGEAHGSRRVPPRRLDRRQETAPPR